MTRIDDADGSSVVGNLSGRGPRPMTRGRFWFAVAACLLGIAILASLGTWQVDRLAWKQHLIDTIDERTKARPEGLAEIERRFFEAGDVEYWPVRLSGRFLHDGERHFLTTFDGAAGWNVYTPLRLEDGRQIFVNRGFVPYAMKDAATRTTGLVEGEVGLLGIARNAVTEKPSMAPDNDLAKNVFFWKSLPEMQQGLPADAAGRFLPFIVDAGPGQTPGVFPVGGTTVIDIPNSHLSYAITWYGLAAVLTVMLVILIEGQRRSSRDIRGRAGPQASAGRTPEG